MSQIKSVVVFCGGSAGKKEIFTKEAFRMGQILAEYNVQLIYGAGGTGMMRAVADGALSEDGYVIGATIQSLYAIERPDLTTKIQKMEVWQTMYDRKVSMTKQADAVCILPGGFGTMDELFEVLTLRQLGISHQPIVIVNTDGFYNTLKKFLEEMVDMGFAKPYQLNLIRFVDSVEDVMPMIRSEMKKAEQEKVKQENSDA